MTIQFELDKSPFRWYNKKSRKGKNLRRPQPVGVGDRDPWFSGTRQSQISAKNSGAALTNHIRVCHNGKLDENCRACQELQEKKKNA